jgi:hypothetical protein
MKPAQARLEALEKRRTSHHYIPGTTAFDEAMYAFYFRVRARCGCTECLQSGDADDNSQCIPGCLTWQDAEADEAEMLDKEDILSRILYERIMQK